MPSGVMQPPERPECHKRHDQPPGTYPVTIDSHRDRFGVEPACAVLEIPPSTYYAAKKREHEATARSVRDEWLKKEIMRVWADKKIGRRVYGAAESVAAAAPGGHRGGAVHGGAAHE
jgi:hypothetical protein